MSKFHTTEFDFYPERAFRPRPGGGMTLEGGKGGDSSVSAPNPQLQVMQMESLSTNNDIARRMLANSEELLPLQREQLQFGLESARTAYDQSQEDRQYALGRRARLNEAMDPFLDEAANYDEGARRAELMAQANADIGMGFDSAQGQQARGLARRGVNLNSGRAQALAQQSELAEASARALAGRKVSEAAKAEGLTLRTNAVNMLSGAPALATNATSAGANYGTAGLGLSNSGIAGMNSGLGSAAATSGNVASSAASMYGAQADRKGRADGAANGAEGEVWGSVLGAGLMLMSDPRLKTDIKPVGRLDNGLAVYTFRYLGSPVTHMGVMADQVQKVLPAAVGEVNGYLAVDYSKL